MRFKVIVNVAGRFNLEALVRAMDAKAHLTRSGWLSAWLTRGDLDQLEDWGAQYRIIY